MHFPSLLPYFNRNGPLKAAESGCPKGFSGIAREQRSDLDDGGRELPHSTQEGGYEPGVELRVGAAFEFAERFVGGPALLVAAVARDGVVGVRNGNDARAQRNGFAAQGVGITGTVEEFVMVYNHLPDAGHRSKRFEQLSAIRHMGLHGLPLVRA